MVVGQRAAEGSAAEGEEVEVLGMAVPVVV